MQRWSGGALRYPRSLWWCTSPSPGYSWRLLRRRRRVRDFGRCLAYRVASSGAVDIGCKVAGGGLLVPHEARGAGFTYEHSVDTSERTKHSSLYKFRSEIHTTNSERNLMGMKADAKESYFPQSNLIQLRRKRMNTPEDKNWTNISFSQSIRVP